MIYPDGSCQDWELRLGEPEAEAHLAMCLACRELAGEIAVNGEAMRAMGEEVMPPVVLPRETPHVWRWASAVAAMLVAGLGLWHLWGPGPVTTPTTQVTVRATAVERPLEPPKVVPALPVLAARVRRPVKRRPSWRLVEVREDHTLVRMQTSDPGVVIYWLIEPQKEELE